MARKVATGIPTQNGSSHGHQKDGDVAPPSTIAAQIVHNRANVTREEPENQELFGRLLQEYLNDPIAEDASLETNAQLIHVVAEAGLDAVQKADPFAPNAAARRANDSLQVLELTLRRSPQILFYNGSDTSIDGESPPLILWLLPKVLGLAGRDGIYSQVVSFLNTCVHLSLTGNRFWRRGQAFLELIRIMIQDTLLAIEDEQKSGSNAHAAFSISLPSSQTFSSLWSKAQHSVALPQGYRCTVLNSVQARHITACLLSVISDTVSIRLSSACPGLEDKMMWAVDCCRRVLSSCGVLSLDRLSSLAPALSTLCGIATTVSSVASSSGRSRSHLELCSELLALADVIRDASYTMSLARLLLALLNCCTNSPNLFRSRMHENLSPVVLELVQDELRFSGLGKPLQIALVLYVQELQLAGSFPNAAEELRAALKNNSMPELEDSDLASDFANLGLKMWPAVASEHEERPAKRIRLDSSIPRSWQEDKYTELVKETAKLTGGDDQYLGDHVEDNVLSLTEEDRCELLELWSLLPCAGCRTLNREDSTGRQLYCTICDKFPEAAQVPPQSFCDAQFGISKTVLSSLEALIVDAEFRRSRKQRLLMAVVVRRFLAHLNDETILQFGSTLGEWCLRSLQSSIRELRIAAAHSMIPFIDNRLPTDVLTSNRVSLVEFLRELSNRNNLSEQETLIFAWSLVGRHCGEKELNLVLLQLVEYLGHPQALICGVAAAEIASLAEDFNKSVGELFRPFWRSVAASVVKDIFSCPQKAQQLSDLLSMSVNDLLLLTQAETVPYLTLTKKKDALDRIAAARGSDTPVRDLWLQPTRSVAAVAASLLLQQHSEGLKTITSLLHELDPDFTPADCQKLIIAEPIHTACEILKANGDSSEIQKVQVLQALKALALIVEKAANPKSTSKSKKALETFLDNQLLGIMANFTDAIDTSKDGLPMAEKQRNLRAVETLITVARAQIGIALPQVRATLQSAFELAGLADQAFSTWVTLLKCIGEEDILSLIDETFAIIVQNWTSFSPSTQKLAHDTIEELIKGHNENIRDRIEMIPSLAGIELLEKIDGEIKRFKSAVDPLLRIDAFCRRCQDENSDLVRQGLQELVPFLIANQKLLHESTIGQQPNPSISQLYRVLLDASLRFKETHADILNLCGQCLGILGSVDPNKMEAVREKGELLMLSNFDRATEVIDFVAYMLESVIVPAFHAAASGKAQTYLAYVMQELLKTCGFRQAVLSRQRPSDLDPAYRRWIRVPETIRFTLMPYLNSKYFVLNPSNSLEQPNFPIFNPQLSHGSWLRSVVFSLLLRPNSENTRIIFPVLSRVIWGHDITIAASLLPFVIQNAVVGGSEADVADVLSEIQAVLLNYDISGLETPEADNVKQCSESLFQVLDYLSRWLQEKRRLTCGLASGNQRFSFPADFDEIREVTQMSKIEKLISSIPANGISKRAIQCGSYARALFHWEQFIREEEPQIEDQDELDAHYRQLQDIYAHIEEPDGIEGISAQLHILDPEQQILEHKRAGRWTAVQSWYELALADDPTDEAAQKELLSCLKASGQQESLLNLAERWTVSLPASSSLVLPYATEAAWLTGKWDVLDRLLKSKSGDESQDFDVGIGKALLAIRATDMKSFESRISTLRTNVMRNFSSATTTSLASAHGHSLKLHALYEVAAIGGLGSVQVDRSSLFETLDRRLELLGAVTDDKQYLLGLRRAAMQLSGFTPQQIAGAWLTTSRLARKGGILNVAYDAVLHATKLHDESATIEHSRILWKDGHHRKAISNLKGAIEAGVFQSYNVTAVEDSVSTRDSHQKEQNPLVSKTQLLLAKWLDQAGLIKSMELLGYYQRAQRSYNRSQSPTYYLGKYYNKILDAEKAVPKGKQTEVFLTGECIKLAIDNYLRSMAFGSKYYYETVPKVLTLWLDFGAEIAEDNSRRLTQAEQTYLATKMKRLDGIHKQLQKYTDRLPPYIWYSALSQIISRINHPHTSVAGDLAQLIKKIVATYPQQAMWSLLAVAKSKDPHKQTRANGILLALRNPPKGNSKTDLNSMVHHGQRLTDGLLGACEKNVDSRSSKVSLHRDLDLNPKLAPCPLVVPIEKTMIASLPSVQTAQAVRQHKPFPANAVTIAAFQDEVLVLSSLQRPRKITLRGSDGQLYALLCKPKDDLRKDNRLMEFNTLISRSLKRDIESSKRRLYIRTYAVTPLNEECGAIEWVDGLKPMRDIILAAYKGKGVKPDYGEIRQLLDRACADPDSGSHAIFTNTILPKFSPILYEWFIETFPEPETWFAARLRYTRSAAVMSIVGHVLGLGDRHGENILLEEGNGGVFHVDFNCLFDKGLTFEKPELVPFRLTHNMVDAMGTYGYEGPFRTAAELTLKCLRQYQDTLMTILETFLYDPTADFVGKPGKRKNAAVPETPQEVLDSVRSKIRGLLPGENVPLSVDGYVDALIRMAVDPRRLAAMYIGWCAFF